MTPVCRLMGKTQRKEQLMVTENRFLALTTGGASAWAATHRPGGPGRYCTSPSLSFLFCKMDIIILYKVVVWISGDYILEEFSTLELSANSSWQQGGQRGGWQGGDRQESEA